MDKIGISTRARARVGVLMVMLAVLGGAGCGDDGGGSAGPGSGIDTGSDQGGSTAEIADDQAGDAAAEGSTDDAGTSFDSGPDQPLDRSACDIVTEQDIEGMTQFPGTTFTVVDTLDEPPEPDDVVFAKRSRCGFNVESRFADGGGSGGSGIWAYVTLTNDLRNFAPDPSWPEYEAVEGVGEDAYWTDGGFTLVIRQGDYVVEIESAVGLDLDQYPDVVEGRQQWILALTEILLPRL